MKKILLLAITVTLAVSQSFAQTLIHYWNFNLTGTEQAHLSPSYTAGSASLTYIAGGDSVNDYPNGTATSFTTIPVQTVFNPGDLLFVAYQMNATPNEDRIAFVTFVNILPGTIINFTDAKYTTTQCAGGISWTAPAAGVPAGSVIVINNDAGTASAGTISGNTFGLSANGDQVIVYTGTNTSPQFITALSSNAWSPSNTSCSGSFSALPASLTDGTNAINLSTATGNTSGNTVNAFYNGPMEGSLQDLKTWITNPANWVGTAGGTPAQTWPVWAFPGPPVVTAAQVVNSTILRVIFNRDLDPVSATDVNHFTGIAGLTSITRTNNGALKDTLLLHYTTPFSSGSSYTLTVANVKDAENRTMVTPFVFTFTYNTTIAFQSQVVSVGENAGQVTIPLTLTNPSVASVKLVVKSAPFSTADSTDFTLRTQTLTFTGDSNSTQFINISVIDDGRNEQDEYFVLSLEDPTGLSITGNTFITVYLRDNERSAPVPNKQVALEYVGSYDPSGSSNASCEIVVYDSATRRLFVISAIQNRLDIADFSNPDSIKPIRSIDMNPYGGITSVAVKNGIVAAAVPNADQQLNGSVIFFNTNGDFQKQVTVGALPDMITFTPDGKKVLTANEGQPNDSYTVDPEGSVSIIDVSGGMAAISQSSVTTLDFTAFNAQTAALIAAGVRKGFPGSTLSQDLEPEYITFSNDSKKAWVILQEANAFAVIDIVAKKITEIWPLGKKDHSLPGNGFDASDRGSFAHIANWPVKGLYMPDGIASYTVNGTTFIVGANEGDDREYSAFNERVRVNDAGYKLDSLTFPNAAVLKNDNNLGRLRITKASGDTDGDGDYDEIHLIGGRSFSIWNTATKKMVWDSKDDFEQYLSKTPLYAPIFNADHESNTPKSRSTSKGPEPEGLALANIDGKQYAFISLERQGGVMVYDITNPQSPAFVDYQNPRKLNSYGGDNGPEGISYISNLASPDGRHYLVVANEISGSLSIYRIGKTTPTITISDVEVDENAGRATVQVCLSEPATKPVTVQYKTANGSAFALLDYFPATGSKTIPAGQTCVSISVPIIDLPIPEQTEYFFINITKATNAIIRDGQSKVTILDDDVIPMITVSDVSIPENAGEATVQVCLSAPVNKTVMALYTTANGTAQAGPDYGWRFGFIAIPAGQTCTSITVPIINNQQPEQTEHFFVNLSFPLNASISDGQAKVTILDNDQPANDGPLTRISVSPNPFVNRVVVNIPWGTEENITLTLYDLQGRQWLTRNLKGKSIKNQVVLEGLQRLAPGTYYLQVQSGTRKEVEKLIKLR